jgi:hypothetical protein
MESSDRPAGAPGRWVSLWVVALLSFLAQLCLCQFFAQDEKTHAFGQTVPFSEDINPSKLWELAYHFPPSGTFQTLNWLGVPYLPQPLNPLSIAAALMSPWFFFTTYVPILATLALLAMAAFLRELEVSRPAALFGAVIYAWQGDVLAFIYPGHYGYLTSWPFYALGAWGALRAQRTGRWPYAIMSGACCGIMVGLLTNADRGGIASLLIGALYLVPLLRTEDRGRALRHFLLVVVTAFLIAVAPLLALFKSNIAGVKIGGASDRSETYKLVTQYSLGPAETLTYLVPGFFGWHTNNPDGLYWGWIGEWPDWPKYHQGPANLNLAISTSGTVATLLAIIGAIVIAPGRLFGRDRLSDRQRFYARALLALGLVSLVLSWGWHTGSLYRFVFDHLPLMDKWRDPLKWLEMFNFALMPLAAIGLDHVLGALDPVSPDSRLVRKRFLLFLGSILTVMVAGLYAALEVSSIFASHFSEQGLDSVTIANMMGTMHTSLIWAILLTVLLGLAHFALWHADFLRRWNIVNPWVQSLWAKMLRPAALPLTLSLALAVLSAAQLGWVAGKFIQPVPILGLTESNPLLDALRQEGDRVRVTVDVSDTTLNILLQNQFAAMDISCLDISAASRIPDDYNTFLRALDNDHARLWFLAGVKNVVVPEAGLAQLRQTPDVAANIAQIEGYTIAQTPSPDLPSHALIGLKDYLAKATFVPAAEELPEAALLKRLKDPAWNPRARILLLATRETESKLPLGSPNPSDQVEVVNYTPTAIEIKAQTTQGGFVLINDQYDPDWEVQVNGDAAPLLRADYIMRAVFIDKGSSKITMHYVPHYLRIPAEAAGLFSDGIMIAAWVVAGLGLRRKN